MKSLTQFQIMNGRKTYKWFNVFNAFSFVLVTGNMLTLYALHLGASSVVIGLINSFSFFSYFALPLGKMWAKRQHIMRVYSNAWTLRNIMLLIMLPIPFLVMRGIPQSGLLLIIISAMLFNLFRGIGLVANNPLVSDLAPGKDRGSYLVMISLISNGSNLSATLCMAVLLALVKPITAFNTALIAGIITGFVSSVLLYKMPLSKSGSDITREKSDFLKNFTVALKENNFKLFLAVFSIIGFGVGMARPFIIVYCREVYGLSNSMVTIVSFFSSLGAICMAVVTRLFIDKIGAKPMYLLFSIASLLSLVPAVFSPHFSGTVLIPVFLCFIAFATNLGFAGEENAAQTYFFTIVPHHALMDLSMVYYMILGTTGAVGSIFGGVILDSLLQGGFSFVNAYRFFFSMQICLIGISVFFQFKLKTMGSYSLKNVIPLFFSLRDIKALNLIYKLEHTEDSVQQTEILSELKGSNSAVAAENLVYHLKSPRFSVRLQALNSMESLPHLNNEVVTALINEIQNGKYTTAHRAAHLLGVFKIQKAAQKLRESIYSDDYILAGESMLSLAKIGDERAQVLIGDIAVKTKNPHVLLWAIQAMQIFSNAASVLILEDLLRHDFETLVVHNEIILALATIIGIEKRFYQSYAAYLEGNSDVNELLTDLYEEIMSGKQKGTLTLPASIHDFAADPAKAEYFMNEFVRPKTEKGMITAMLISSMFDTDLTRLESYRFFVCFWMIMASGNKKLLAK